MKKIILTILITTATYAVSNAQFQLSGMLGNNFSAASQLINNTEPVTGTVKPVFGTLGAGVNLGLSANYFFKSNIGARIDFAYCMGKQFETQNIYNGSLTGITTISGNNFSVAPMLVIKNPMNKINLYAFVGPIIASCNTKISMHESGSGAQTGNYTVVMSGNMALGWKAGIGIDYKLSESTFLFLELHNNSISYKPAQMENTEAYANDKKDDTIIFASEKTAQDPKTKRLQVSLPFSSIGINVGFKISLTK